MSFGSPAADYVEPKLDLNRLLAPHPVSTYFLRMDTDRLLAEGGGEFRVVRYVSRPATGIACGVWGVVTSVIRQLS